MSKQRPPRRKYWTPTYADLVRLCRDDERLLFKLTCLMSVEKGILFRLLSYRPTDKTLDAHPHPQLVELYRTLLPMVDAANGGIAGD